MIETRRKCKNGTAIVYISTSTIEVTYKMLQRPEKTIHLTRPVHANHEPEIQRWRGARDDMLQVETSILVRFLTRTIKTLCIFRFWLTEKKLGASQVPEHKLRRVGKDLRERIMLGIKQKDKKRSSAIRGQKTEEILATVMKRWAWAGDGTRRQWMECQGARIEAHTWRRRRTGMNGGTQESLCPAVHEKQLLVMMKLFPQTLCWAKYFISHRLNT